LNEFNETDLTSYFVSNSISALCKRFITVK